MKQKYFQIIKEALEIEDTEILFSDVLTDFDEWDSMSRLSLIALLDEHFEVEISDSEFDEVNTVEDLYSLVENRTKSSG